MRPQHHPAHKFSHVSPIYNWIYPISGKNNLNIGAPTASECMRYKDGVNVRRAIYLHTPFCDTICTFCPLIKGPKEGDENLSKYVDAVVREIEIKGQDKKLTDLPIRAIFFGGGSPSLLREKDIFRIGAALSKSFDLSALEEFSIEFEAKSVTSEKILAFREIGATHARFGVQTFIPRHRKAFNLTTTLEQIYSVAEMLSTEFPYSSCDMLYGFNGQTLEEFVNDFDCVISLKLKNIDYYPINIFVIQKKLHRYYREQKWVPVSGMNKLYMSQLLREMMRENGYLPHNGHGYVRVSGDELQRNPAVTRAYSFKYHEHVYGSSTDEFIGIGNSAQSYLGGYTIANELSRERYVANILNDNSCPVKITEHAAWVNATKTLAITLPYFGRLDKDKVEINSIPSESLDRLGELVSHGIIEHDEQEYRLTHEGWLWYTSVMYYLCPEEERAALAKIIIHGEHGRLSLREIELLTAAA